VRAQRAADARVTVRIGEEVQVREANQEDTEIPLFGMWRDRGKLADVEALVRKLRAYQGFRHAFAVEQRIPGK
jgi:hypothetical protein